MSTIKLGANANLSEAKGRSWCVATELQSDIVVEVKDVRFHLHKFPLLSRSGLLNRLVFESRDTQKNRIRLDEVPGGPEAFELAAKFCYGMPVDMDASNVAALWCAAVHLEMTEDLEDGNLVSKAEAFFNTVVLGSWKDSVTVLLSCGKIHAWAERLMIVQRCTESIAWKACTDPRGVRSSHGSRMGSRAQSPSRRSMDLSSSNKQELMKEWWFDDLLKLPVDYFKKVMAAIRVKGMKLELIAGAVALYALSWLPRRSEIEYDQHSFRGKGRLLLEQVLSMLPRGKDLVPSRFLMHLIRMAHLLEADLPCKIDLEQRAGTQLDSAALSDLLVPALDASSCCGLKVDVDLVQRLVEHFVRQDEIVTSNYGSGNSVVLDHRVRVATLVDNYLAEISQDRNLSVARFKALAEALPDSYRASHDYLYTAINIFLKVHPELKDEERKDLCQLLDCKRLSLHSSMHAAQNERLPLRTVMQILFFEHLKLKNSSQANQKLPMEVPKIEGGGTAALQQEIRTIRCELEQMKADFSEFQNHFRSLKLEKQNSDVRSKLKKLGVRIY
ncbi:root phototropism protein 3 [Selaginella moellendorffii]|uniref:root phototropism protein 3 n=1 Tax=Selaginella moellendorffii TaxID=88036 RepID=UPI000D1CDFEF|nr:root phototropism protein 3 [Selaginella moellendorffii]XP_024529505.1 root phototropism protein 3 [Selaginella moellendorffii]|eukprot:XP_024529504.1 root phototropism protein 3 [Selaginella moellendorffii]